MAKRFGFSRKEKLKSRKAIDALFTGGQSLGQFPLRAMYLLHPVHTLQDTGVQVGVTASKRHFKKAVHRNRVKRLLRESYRLQKTALLQTVAERQLKLQVFFMYMDKELPTTELLREAMSKCLLQLQKAANRYERPA